MIRPARPGDADAIARLLDQLGYPGTASFLPERIQALATDLDETLAVAEQDGEVVGVLSLHIIPQLAVEGPFARVSYLVVDEAMTGQGVGRALLEYAESVARARGCDRMELHSATRRTRAHQFYLREGYMESPKYLMKSLRNALTLLTLVAGALGACGGSDSTAPDTVVFAFRLRDQPASQEFRVATSSPETISAARAQLALPAAQRNLFPNGPIAAGNGGHNLSWGWHFTDLQLVELSIELCDGNPSLVQADLPYWLNTVKRFCPWSAYVYAEVR